MLALDFVSLLLSKYASQAKMTMSDSLKQSIPTGTLEYDYSQNTELSEAEKTTNDLVAQGQRLRSLTRTADTLLDAAGRLEKEVKKETKYWEQVLSIADAGWSVCRVSRDSEMLGVQLGFSEGKYTLRTHGMVHLLTIRRSWPLVQAERLYAT